VEEPDPLDAPKIPKAALWVDASVGNVDSIKWRPVAFRGESPNAANACEDQSRMSESDSDQPGRLQGAQPV
jgi:hypothetical protein